MRADACTRREVMALATGAALTLLLPPPWLVAGKTADARKEFFDEGRVLKVNLELKREDMDSLRREPRKYVKATLHESAGEHETVYKDVGLHTKGAAGSNRPIDDKPGMTLNMGKFEGDQHFHGMTKFHLNNSVQDPSYLSDLLCGELFRSVGVPASRFTHALVTINDRKCGLYCLKEGFDKSFLKANFGSSDGNFYDGGFLRDLDQPLDLVSGKDDVKDRKDLKALFTAARINDPARRFRELERLLELDKFVSYVAMEVVTWDWDGYPMKQNNYRLYHDPKRDKITFIPSGMDQMFGEPDGPLFPEFGGAVARALIQTPEGRKRYVARMKEILQDSFDVEKLIKRLDELQDRLRPALESVGEGAARDYPGHVDRLRDGIRRRQKSLEQQLKRARA
jgi:spore coat protein H